MVKFCHPSTYTHRTVTGVAHIETVVLDDGDGWLDLSFDGLKFEVVGDPPQSAVPSVLTMTAEQHQRVGRLQHQKGDHQDLCRRVYDRVQTEKDGRVVAAVLSTDMEQIRETLARGDRGDWQDLFREIMQANA